MKVAIGSDHAAFEEKAALKKYLEKTGYEVIDVGADSAESTDYPDYAKAVAKHLMDESCERGVLLCHTGIGMSMTANRFAGVRAALVHDEYSAKMSRMHNNANVLCFGAASNTVDEMKKMVALWFKTEFAGGERHVRRVSKISSDI